MPHRSRRAWSVSIIAGTVDQHVGAGEGIGGSDAQRRGHHLGHALGVVGRSGDVHAHLESSIVESVPVRALTHSTFSSVAPGVPVGPARSSITPARRSTFDADDVGHPSGQFEDAASATLDDQRDTGLLHRSGETHQARDAGAHRRGRPSRRRPAVGSPGWLRPVGRCAPPGGPWGSRPARSRSSSIRRRCRTRTVRRSGRRRWRPPSPSPRGDGSRWPAPWCPAGGWWWPLRLLATSAGSGANCPSKWSAHVNVSYPRDSTRRARAAQPRSASAGPEDWIPNRNGFIGRCRAHTDPSIIAEG